jgi:hypothetical protein
MKFINCFPNSEIAAIYENQTVDAFGFTIIKNGTRIRFKDGCDGEIFNDFGELLEEERRMYENATVDEVFLEELREDMDGDEVANYLAFSDSYSFSIELPKRYLGEKIYETYGKITFTEFEQL